MAKLYDSDKHHRRSVRLPHFDYGDAGAYFVTICTAHMKPVFGRIEEDAVRLHPYGQIVREEWERSAKIRPEIALDEFVVMPNHFHAIVLINTVGAHGCVPNNITPTNDVLDVDEVASDSVPETTMAHSRAPLRRPRSISSLIAQFKASVTRGINAHRLERNLPPVVVWQRSFYDRVIRDEKELLATQKYIIENPIHWEHDEHHPL